MQRSCYMGQDRVVLVRALRWVERGFTASYLIPDRQPPMVSEEKKILVSIQQHQLFQDAPLYQRLRREGWYVNDLRATKQTNGMIQFEARFRRRKGAAARPTS